MDADLDQIEAQRRALTGHCYRMLGSAVDADDATQETMIRAWKSLDQFDGRASLHTWLYRIATNVCLDEIAKRGRRARPMEEGPPASSGSPPPDKLIQRPRTHWIELIADDCAIATDADPSERAIRSNRFRPRLLRESKHCPFRLLRSRRRSPRLRRRRQGRTRSTQAFGIKLD